MLINKKMLVGLKGLFGLTCYLTLLLIQSTGVGGQSTTDSCNRTTHGRSFYLTFMEVANLQALNLQIFASRGVAGTQQISVTIDNGAVPQTSTIDTDEPLNVQIPSSAMIRGSTLSTNGGIIITATADVSVVALVEQASACGAITILPTGILGRRYIATTYAPRSGAPAGSFLAEIAAVATTDNTQIQFTFPATMQGSVILDGTTYTASQTLTVQLNRLGRIQIQSENDLSGIQIISSANIAAFSGNAQASLSEALGPVMEQLVPVAVVDSSSVYVFHVLPTALGYAIKLVAYQSGTTVTILTRAGSEQINLPNIGSFTFRQIESGEPVIVESNKPLQAMELGVSRPSMMSVPSIISYLPEYRFAIPFNTDAQDYVNTILIVANESDIHSFELDGASIPTDAISWQSINIPGYTYALGNVTAAGGYHVITSNKAGARFAVAVYGSSSQRNCAYSYPAEMCLDWIPEQQVSDLPTNRPTPSRSPASSTTDPISTVSATFVPTSSAALSSSPITIGSSSISPLTGLSSSPLSSPQSLPPTPAATISTLQPSESSSTSGESTTSRTRRPTPSGSESTSSAAPGPVESTTIRRAETPGASSSTMTPTFSNAASGGSSSTMTPTFSNAASPTAGFSAASVITTQPFSVSASLSPSATFTASSFTIPSSTVGSSGGVTGSSSLSTGLSQEVSTGMASTSEQSTGLGSTSEQSTGLGSTTEQSTLLPSTTEATEPPRSPTLFSTVSRPPTDFTDLSSSDLSASRLPTDFSTGTTLLSTENSTGSLVPTDLSTPTRLPTDFSSVSRQPTDFTTVSGVSTESSTLSGVETGLSTPGTGISTSRTGIPTTGTGTPGTSPPVGATEYTVPVDVATQDGQSILVHITNPSDSPITVILTFLGEDKPITVSPRQVHSEFISRPPSFPSGLPTETARLSSDSPYVVSVTMAGSCSAYLAIPVVALGTRYQIITWDPSSSLLGYAWFTISAVKATLIRVSIREGSCTVKSSYVTLSCGDDFELYLPEDSTVTFRSISDISGTTVDSDQPVLVVAGNDDVSIGADSVVDNSVSELFPVEAWGTEFVVPGVPENDGSGFSIKMSSGSVSAIVTVQSSSVTTTHELSEGLTVIVNFTDNSFLHIVSDNPIQVVQFVRGGAAPATGCPSSLYVTPTSLYLDTYYTDIWVSKSQYVNYVTIIIEGSAVDGLTLDDIAVGGSNWIDVPGTTLKSKQQQINTERPKFSHPTTKFGLFRYSYSPATDVDRACALSYVAGADWGYASSIVPTSPEPATSVMISGTATMPSPTTASVPPTLELVTDCSCLGLKSTVEPAINGQYYLEDNQLNGRPVYKKPDCEMYIYDYEDKNVGYWVVSKELGSGKAYAINTHIYQAVDKTDPKDWTVYNNASGKFVADPEFSITCNCSFRQECSGGVFVYENGTSLYDGVFKYSGKVLNGRSVYTHDSQDLKLYYNKQGCGYWVLSQSTDSPNGVIYAFDTTAQNPGNIASWRLQGQESTSDTIRFRCYLASAGDS